MLISFFLTLLLQGLFTTRDVGVNSEKVIYIGEGGVVLKGTSYVILPNGKRIDVNGSFETIISKGGKYIGIMTLRDNLVYFTLFDRDGNELWAKGFNMGKEGGPDFYISDLGITVSVDVPSLTLYLYDLKGNLIRKVKPVKDAGYNEERAFAIDIGKDGLHFVISALEKYGGPSYIILYDFEGVRLFRKKLDGVIPFRVFISPHEDYIVASMYKVEKRVVGESRTLIIKNDGTLLRDFPFLAEGAIFTGDQERMAVWGKRWFCVYSLPDLELKFKKTTERKVLTASFSLDGSLLIWTFSGHYERNYYIYDHLYFSIYNADGSKIESGSLERMREIPLIHPGYKNFKVALDGKLVEITF